MRQKPKTFLLRFVLVVSSLLVGVLLAEGLTRVFFPHLAPRTARLTKFWQYDPRYGWSHQPGVRGTFDSFGIQTAVTINDRGFRGPEIAYDRAPQRRRILVLGDSYVWGYGVNDEEVFTERLRQLRPEVEIVNLGVSGYSTDQELLLYGDEGYKYQADEVILVLTENDFIGNLLTQQYVIYGKPAFQRQDGGLTLINQPVPPTPWWKHVVAQVAAQSYVLTAANRYLYSRAIAKTVASGTSADAVPISARPFPRTPEQDLAARLLIQLQQEIATRQGGGQGGSKLLVVCTEDVTGSRELVEYLATRGIAGLDLKQFMEAKDKSIHLTNDTHWNAEGHKRVAEILAQHLGSS